MARAVVIVDEDAVLRESLALLLDDEPGLEVRGAWADAATLLPAAGEPVPTDLVLLSTGLPRGSFVPTCVELARRWPVLVLSKGEHDRSLMRALEAGALGAVTTEGGYDELLGTVGAALRGEACVPRGMLGGLLRELIDRRRRDDEVRARHARLTARERETLDLLARGEDVDGIATQLFISRQTVRSHLQRVLDKLEVHSRAEAVALLLDHELGGTPARREEER